MFKYYFSKKNLFSKSLFSKKNIQHIIYYIFNMNFQQKLKSQKVINLTYQLIWNHIHDQIIHLMVLKFLFFWLAYHLWHPNFDK